jgi:hypothetical protein
MNASAHDTLHPGEVMGLFSCVTRDESRAIALEIARLKADCQG